MNKRILVIGANGMLGGSIFRYFSLQSGYEVLGSVRNNAAALSLAAQGFKNVITSVDVRDNKRLHDVFHDFKPDFVFNCVGLIKQLNDSKNPISAIEINSLLPHRLASFANQFNCKLIHFSTDCVFSGKDGNYFESDIPDATDIYGRSKLLGEVSYDGHLTLRTSIIGHEINSNLSLVDWFLSQDGPIDGFSKAIFSGLPTCYVAEFVHHYVLDNPELSGLLHLSVDPIDKYTLLMMIKDVYQKNIVINEKTSFEIDRSLNSNQLREITGFCPVSWSELVERMYVEYKKYFV
jgi:dTDP-4-dehydrorhamnose reductase